MLNYVVLVGRINEIVLDNNEGNLIKLKVDNPYKNDKGEYEYNIIPCILRPSFNNSIFDLCNVNDILGIKGLLENKEDRLYVVAEKVSLLSSKNADNKVEA